VAITLRSVARFSWSGLSRLADGLLAERVRRPVRLYDVAPHVRSLLEVLGMAQLVESDRGLGRSAYAVREVRTTDR